MTLMVLFDSGTRRDAYQKLRNQRGWSQEQLAAKLQIAGWDLSRNGLAKIETRIQPMRDYQLALPAQRIAS